MPKDEILIPPATNLLSLAKTIHSWIALALTVATSLDGFFPNILSPIGISTAIRPYFNLFAVVLIVFFLVTNFAVWAFTSMYAPTLDGLLLCYVLALPFYAYTLAGDLVWNTVFAGSWALYGRRTGRQSRAASVRTA